jgi:hypothetical protein
MEQLLTTNEYIAINAPDEAVNVLAKYGLAPVTNDAAHIARALNVMVDENGDPALKDLMSVHPDKEFILHYNQPAVAATADMSKSANNQAGNNQEVMHNFGGMQVSNTMLIVGAIFIAAIIISKNN